MGHSKSNCLCSSPHRAIVLCTAALSTIPCSFRVLKFLISLRVARASTSYYFLGVYIPFIPCFWAPQWRGYPLKSSADTRTLYRGLCHLSPWDHGHPALLFPRGLFSAVLPEVAALVMQEPDMRSVCRVFRSGCCCSRISLPVTQISVRNILG